MANFELRAYQKQIINELKHLPAYALYMGTGTGKTITALELMKHNPTSNLLVVCPHSAIEQWKSTVRSHFPHFNVIDFKKSWASKQINEHLKTVSNIKNKVVVINYDMVHRVPILLDIVNGTWTIIADEIHRIKNYGTKTKPVKATQYMIILSYNTDYKMGLSATPTQGDFGGYIDYYPQLRFLGYTDLTFRNFYAKHVQYIDKSYGSTPYPIRTIVGYKNVRDIDNLLKIVAKHYVPSYGEFPPQFNTIELERCPNYAKLVREKAYVTKDVRIMLNNSSRSRVAKKTMTTGTIMGHDLQGHTYTCDDNTVKLDWLEDFLNDTNDVVSVFYTYNVELANLEQLCKRLKKKYIVINGNEKNKYELVNAGGYDVVLGQFQAMSEALDGLQNYCHIEVFFSMPESSILYLQSIGRIDRIGQKGVPMYYFLIMQKTIDALIMYNIEHKIEFSEATLNLLSIQEEL